MHRTVPSLLVLLAAVLLTACEREEAPDGDVDMVVDHAYLMAGLHPLLPYVLAMDPGPGRWHLLPDVDCSVMDSISGDTAGYPLNGPVRLHLSYPPGGCEALDGREREGVLIVEVEGVPDTLLAKVRISASDLDQAGLRARFGISCTRLDSLRWMAMLDSSFVFRSGAWSRRSTGTLVYRLQDAGSDSLAGDERYSVALDVNGQDRHGRAFHAFTLSDLLVAADCGWALSGLERLEPAENDVRDLDHGGGTCDAQATILLGDGSIGLTIP